MAQLASLVRTVARRPTAPQDSGSVFRWRYRPGEPAALERYLHSWVTLRAGSGEVAGLTYQIEGSGPPLVLLPLFLAPSQWAPLVPRLAEKYTIIRVGGTNVGAVGLLESRGRSAGYEQMLRSVFDEVRLASGESVVEIGSGSGVVSRWLARHTGRANRIVGVDVNRYLLDEAAALVRAEGLSDVVEFREGSAEALPFADASVDVALSVTVIEEVDATRLLSEMVRVTRPGGRLAVIARGMDLPPFMNLSLSPDVAAKIARPGFLGAVSEQGCADASRYRRMREAGLTNVVGFPHLTPFRRRDGVVLDFIEDIVLAALDRKETDAWRRARERADAEETLFLTWPHHCAVGTKPRD